MEGSIARRMVAGIGALAITFGMGHDEQMSIKPPTTIHPSAASKEKVVTEYRQYQILLIEFVLLTSDEQKAKLKMWADENFDPVFIVQGSGWRPGAIGAFPQPDGRNLSFLSIDSRFIANGFWLTLTEDQDSQFFKGEIPGLKPHSAIADGNKIYTKAQYNGDKVLLFFVKSDPPKK